ncbi:MAG: PDZ domain-containing protein [Acidimicrobiia bacterium]
MIDPSTTLTPPRPARSGARWPFFLAVTFLAVGMSVALLWPVKVPYFAMSPGPIEPVADLVTIKDASTFELDGSAFLLTVGLKEVNAFEWLEARFFDPQVDLIPREAVRPSGVSREELTRTNLQAMDASIDTAVFVALDRAGYEVGFTGSGVEVLQIVEGSPAEGVLLLGDRITEIAGTAVVTETDAAAVIRSFGIGDTITLSGTRGSEPLKVEITLVPHTELPDTAMVGVLLSTLDLEMVLPFDVRIDSRNIGGPSAGLIYAITLLDLLTEEDLLKGYRVAATGSIHFDETVGSIGGVRQKIYAARALGVDIVFVPTANYEAALTAEGDGVVIVPVDTLQDALDHLAALEPKAQRLAAN